MGKRRDRRQQSSGRRVKLDLWSDEVVAPSEMPESREALCASLGEEVTPSSHHQASLGNLHLLSSILFGEMHEPRVLMSDAAMLKLRDDDLDAEDESAVLDTNKASNGAENNSLKGQDEEVVNTPEDVDATEFPTENCSLSKPVPQNTNDEENQSPGGLVVYNEHAPRSGFTSATEVEENLAVNEWQAVLHQDSGEYYYWNTVTGETTWEKPALANIEIRRIDGSGSPLFIGNQTLVSDTEPHIAGLSSGVERKDDCKVSDQDLEGMPRSPHETQITEKGVEIDTHLESDGQQKVSTTLEESQIDDLEKLRGSDESVQQAQITSADTELKNEEVETKEDKNSGDLEDKAKQINKCEAEKPRSKQLSEDVEEKNKDELKSRSEGTDGEEGEKVANMDGVKDAFKEEAEKSKEVEDAIKEGVNDETGCARIETYGIGENGIERHFDKESLPLQSTLTCSSGAELISADGSCLTNSAERADGTTDNNADVAVEERGSKLIQWGETVLERLHALAGDTLMNIPMHARLAIETHTRIADWKVFLSMGNIPEHYLSLMQSQIGQLESAVSIEEAVRAAQMETLRVLQLNSSTQLAPEGIQSSGPGHFDKATDWAYDWGGYHEGKRRGEEQWKPDHIAGAFGNGTEAEEGEIRTVHNGFNVPYLGSAKDISEEKLTTRSNTNVGAPEMLSDGCCVDVDMEVDMDVDDEVEAEPAVPGVSTHMSNPCLPSILCGVPPAPLDPASSLESVQLYPFPVTSEGWAPPPPPEDEWAPPPPIEAEIIPPPPPEDPPPLPPQSPHSVCPYSMPLLPPVIPVEYYAPEYVPEYTPAQEYMPMSAPDYQAVPDSTFYVASVDEVPGSLYANTTLSSETIGVDPYIVPPESGLPYNGWPAPGVPLVPSAPSVGLVAAEHSVQYSESLPLAPSVPPALAVTSAPAVPSLSPVATTTVESSVAATSLEPKKLLKGKLGKKRTHTVAVAPMLMTNKKVSSLVSKWKQAKEELHGSGEDEDDKVLYDLEILEKKKQKEIEEWRRQQIASGEALDNANFQPLGTLDWRERVKRAKKVEAKESEIHVESSSSMLSQKEEPSKERKPDLMELSKGLPVGWQAFWDDASGEVYYGNLSTQETSWDRPVT